MQKMTKTRLMGVDRFFISVIVLFGTFVPMSLVYSKSMLSKSNIDVEKIKYKVERQANANESLSMQVDELASLSNIQGIAKEYGLSYNNDNIIVINN